MVTAPAKPLDSSTKVEPAVPAPSWEGDPLVIALPPGMLTDDVLLEIAELNDHWHFERNSEGGLEVSPPPGTNSGKRGLNIVEQIGAWSRQAGAGDYYASGSGFSLLIGSERDPDACWISDQRLATVDPLDEGIWQVCPDLVCEVRSAGQTVRKQREKMEEWLRAGARLGWLIDPFTDDGVVWVYRAGQNEPERLARPDTLNGEDVAEGLTVDLGKVWRPIDRASDLEKCDV